MSNRCRAGISGVAAADCALEHGHDGAHECHHEAGGMTRWYDECGADVSTVEVDPIDGIARDSAGVALR